MYGKPPSRRHLATVDGLRRIKAAASASVSSWSRFPTGVLGGVYTVGIYTPPIPPSDRVILVINLLPSKAPYCDVRRVR